MQSERLHFQHVTPEHAERFRAIMDDPDMGRHTDVPCKPTEKRARGFVAWMARLNESGKGRAWALKHRGEIIGFIRLNRIDKTNQHASVGYEIGRAYWGQGFASEAVGRLVPHGHQELGLHRLEAWVWNGNDASARVLEKAGFAQEGVQRAKVVHRGERRDLWLFGRLASDPI